jgi:hypothetical protein
MQRLNKERATGLEPATSSLGTRPVRRLPAENAAPGENAGLYAVLDVLLQLIEELLIDRAIPIPDLICDSVIV